MGRALYPPAGIAIGGLPPDVRTTRDRLRDTAGGLGTIAAALELVLREAPLSEEHHKLLAACRKQAQFLCDDVTKLAARA